MRFIMQFMKIGDAAYISHLDLQRAMQRAMRRAGLPLRYSLGYNPHPLVSFAMASPVGMMSQAEYVDARVEDDCDLTRAALGMIEALPAPLAPVRAMLAPDDYPTLTARVRSAEFRLTFPKSANLAEKWDAYLASDALPVQKHGKSGMRTLDMKPLILTSKTDAEALETRLAAGSDANLNPMLLGRDFCARFELEDGFGCLQKALYAGSADEPADLFDLV